ncbi:MAG: leucine-rich repeat domain-containing protein [Leptospiraceae bacterium]|nr:leucine-rich repeat domain-containing protein [Leptospiraceae bacterium]
MNQLLHAMERLRPIWAQILFVLYSLLIAPYIVESLHQPQSSSAQGIGWILLCVLMLEIPVLHILINAARFAAKQEGNAENSSGTAVFFAWLAHMVIVIILYFQAITAIDQNAIDGWPGFLIVLLVLKELYVLFLILSDDPGEPSRAAVLLARAGYLVFMCLAYTAWWGLMIQNVKFSVYSTGLMIMEIGIASFFFAILHAAVQIPEIVFVSSANNERFSLSWIFGFCISLVFVLIPVMRSEFTGRYLDLDEALKNKNEVKILALQRGQLTRMDAGICRLPQLQRLFLFENRLLNLPDCIGQLQQLSELSVSYNHLQTLPPTFGDLQNLQELRIYVNKLEALPPGFGRLHQLRKLNAGWNQLTALPLDFGNLRSLRWLRLQNCQLHSLPAGFGKLEALRYLDLSGNQLRTLPESFFDLKLDELDLSGNKLDPALQERIRKRWPSAKITL